MPRYDFQCQQCQETFEFSLSLNDYIHYYKEKQQSEDSILFCPSCESKEVKQVFTGGGAFLKSGFSKDPVSSCATGGCCSGGSCGF